MYTCTLWYKECLEGGEGEREREMSDFFMSKGGREGERVSLLGKAGHISSPKMTQKSLLISVFHNIIISKQGDFATKQEILA